MSYKDELGSIAPLILTSTLELFQLQAPVALLPGEKPPVLIV
jgi:hypothetical protein